MEGNNNKKVISNKSVPMSKVQKPKVIAPKEQQVLVKNIAPIVKAPPKKQVLMNHLKPHQHH